MAHGESNRLAKEELEEMGESTEDLADSVSTLRNKIKSLSGVDIMLDDDTFKSTTQIMVELGRAYENLTDVSQAALTEILGGKRGANVVASILTNIEDLEAALVSSENSAGSALKENLKYLESIEGKISQLKASWQEFWDASPIEDVAKSVLDLASAFLQVVNSAGGLSTVLGAISISTLLMNLDRIQNKILLVEDSISGMTKTLSGLRSALNRNGVSTRKFLLDSLFGKSSLNEINGQINNVAESVSKAFNSALRRSGGSGVEAEIAGIRALDKYTRDLSDTERERIKVEIQRAAATGQNIAADKLAASTTQIVTQAQAAGTRQAQAYAAAQSAVGAALRIGVSIAIPVILSMIREYREEQDRLKKTVLDNAKTQIEQADSVRTAVKSFEKINESYKNGHATADEYQSAIRRVTEAIGDQMEVLKGIPEGTDAWWNGVKEIMEEMDAAADRASKLTLEKVFENRSLIDKFTSKDFYKRLLGDMFKGVHYGVTTGRYNAYRDNASIMLNEYAKVEKATSFLYEKIEELEKKKDSLLDEKAIKKVENEISFLNKEIDALNSGFTSGDIENFNSQLDAITKYVKNELKDVDNVVDYYARYKDELQDVIDKYGLSSEVYDVAKKRLDELYPAYARMISKAEEAKEALNIGASIEDLLSLDYQDLDLISGENLNRFKMFTEEQGLMLVTMRQVNDAILAFKKVEGEAAKETNTLTGQINANKEAIDKYQDSVSRLGSILTADYSNNASGLIDDLQELVEIIGKMDASSAEQMFSKLNKAITVDDVVVAMKEVSDIAIDKMYKDIVEAMNLVEPAAQQMLYAFLQQQKQVETLTSSLDEFKSSYQSLTSVIKDYNENGFLTADNINAILSMSPEYLAALDFEGNKLKFNHDALKALVKIRLADAERQIEANRHTRISAIYAEQEARSKGKAAELTYEHAQALLEEAIAAGKSENEIIHLEKQVQRLYEKRERLSGQTYSGKLDEDLQEQVDAINESSDAAVASIRYVGEEFDKGSDDALAKFMGLTDSIEKETEDASKELKSQIDSTLSHWKSALDSGAINYKQYLDKMKAMRDQYADQLSTEDLLQLDLDIAQEDVNMWKEAIGAYERSIDRELIKPIQDSIDALEEQKEALEKNKQATSDYYDSIIDGFQTQKDAIEDQIKAVEKSYEAQIKPLEEQQKAINKEIKAIEKEKRVIEDQQKVLEKSKRPYEKAQKEIQKQIKAIEKEIKVLEKSKKPYEDKQKAIEKEIKGIEKEIKALERTKRPYEQQQKAINKQIKAIEKEIKALERTKRPYEQQRKEIEKHVKAIEKQVRALEDTKKPYEDQQKAIDKQIKAIQKQIKALEKTKKPYEDQKKEIDNQVKAIEKQIKALEKTKKPFEEQQKAIDKETKAIQKQIKEIQKTEEPYKEEQAQLQKSVRAIEQKIKALEKLQKPYKDQLTVVNQEIAALEREIELLERSKAPIEKRKQAIQNQVDALNYQTSVIERQEKAYKREQDAINREIELLEREVSVLERRKKPYEIAQRHVERQISLLQKEQKELEKLKKPYEDEIAALQKELELMQKANEERQFAMELQQAEYNLRRAQQQRTSYVYQDGQFQYVADQGAIKDAQKAMDDLEYEKSVKRVEDAMDKLQAKIDEITDKSDQIQNEIDDLTDQNESLAESIQMIQDRIDPLQDKIDDLTFKNSELEWSISDVEWSMRGFQYAIEDLESEMEDLDEEMRQIDVALQPLEHTLESLKNSATDLQLEIDQIQQKIDPLNNDIAGLNDRIQELQLTIDEIEESLDPLQKRIDELAEHNELLQESIDEITESIEPLNEEIDELNERSEEIQEAIDAISEAIDPLNDQIDELQEQSDAIQEFIDEITSSIDELNKEIDALNRQGEEIQEQIDAVDEAIQPLQDSIEELNDANEELQEQIDAIDEAIQPLQDHIEELQEQSEDLQQFIDAIDEAIEPLQERIEALNEENDELQEHIDAINEEIDELNELLEPLNDRIEELNRQNEDLQETIDALKEAQEAETEALRAQTEAIDEQIDYYQQLKDQAEQAIQAQIDKIDEHVESLNKEVEAIEKYKDQVTAIFDEIDKRKDEDLLTAILGEGWQEKLKSLDPNIISEFATGYEGATERLKAANQAVIDSLEGPEGLDQAADKADAEVTELKGTMESGDAAMGSGSIKDAMDQTAITAINLGTSLNEAEIAMGTLWNTIRTHAIDINGFLDLYIRQKLDEIKEQFEKHLPEAMDFWKRVIVDDDGPQIILQLQAINQELKTFDDTIRNEIIPAFNGLADYISGDSFKSKINGTFTEIKEHINREVDEVVNHVNNDAVPGVEKRVEEAKNKINGHIDDVTRHVTNNSLPTIERETGNMLDRIAGETDSMLSKLIDQIERHVDDVCGRGGIIDVGCQNVLNTVEETASNISGGNNSIMNRLVRDIQNDVDEIVRSVERGCDDIVRKVNDSVNEVCSKLDEVSGKFNDIKGAAESAAGAVEQIGNKAETAQGPASGLREIFWNIEGAVKSTSNTLDEVIRKMDEAIQKGNEIPQQNNDGGNNGDGGGDDSGNQAQAMESKSPTPDQQFDLSGSKDKPRQNYETSYVNQRNMRFSSDKDHARAETLRRAGYDIGVLDKDGKVIEIMERYALGGVVSNRPSTGPLTSIAKSVGEDKMVAVRNGERILTPQQNKDFEKLVKVAPKIVKSLEDVQKSAQGIAADIGVRADISDAVDKLNDLERKVQDAKYVVNNEVDAANAYAKDSARDVRDAIAGDGGMIDEMTDWIGQDVDNIVGEEGIVPTGLRNVAEMAENTTNYIGGEEGLMDQLVSNIDQDIQQVEQRITDSADYAIGITGALANDVIGASNATRDEIGNDIDSTVSRVQDGGNSIAQISREVSDDILSSLSSIEGRINAVKDRIQEAVESMDNLAQSTWNAKGAIDSINGSLDSTIPKLERAASLNRDLKNSAESNNSTNKSSNSSSGGSKPSVVTSSSQKRKIAASEPKKNIHSEQTYKGQPHDVYVSSTSSKTISAAKSNSSKSPSSNSKYYPGTTIRKNLTDKEISHYSDADLRRMGASDELIADLRKAWKTDPKDFKCPECGNYRETAQHKIYWYSVNYGIDATIEKFGAKALANMYHVSEEGLYNALKIQLERGGYSVGGVVPSKKRNDFFSSLANSVGEDKMIAVQSGERVLTSKQNKDFENLVRLTPELINASESLAKYAKLFDSISTVNSLASEDNITRNVNGVVNRANAAPVMNNTMSLTIGDIHVHDVGNADDLARQIKNNLPNSLLQRLGKAG